MWHKRHRDKDVEVPPGKRLRGNTLDLYGTGQLGAERCQDLIEDAGALAQSLGSSDMADLRRRGQGSERGERNVARDLRRKLLKTSHWHICTVRMWMPKKQEMSLEKMAFLLPREPLHRLKTIGSTEALTESRGLDAPKLKRHAVIREAIGGPFISCSLWGGGVAFSWHHKKSADTRTLRLPGLAQKERRDCRFSNHHLHPSRTRRS